MIAVLIILATMSVPLAAILASAAVKMRTLDGRNPALERRVIALELERSDLRARLEVLETIATAPSLPSHTPFTAPPRAPHATEPPPAPSRTAPPAPSTASPPPVSSTALVLRPR